jgi:hypothetical protein
VITLLLLQGESAYEGTGNRALCLMKMRSILIPIAEVLQEYIQEVTLITVISNITLPKYLQILLDLNINHL